MAQTVKTTLLHIVTLVGSDYNIIERARELQMAKRTYGIATRRNEGFVSQSTLMYGYPVSIHECGLLVN